MRHFTDSLFEEFTLIEQIEYKKVSESKLEDNEELQEVNLILISFFNLFFFKTLFQILSLISSESFSNSIQ